MVNKPAIIPLTAAPENPSDKEPITIAKPDEFSLERFRSKRDPVIAGVETLITALPHYSMSQAKDWVRLHPDEEKYWSPEYCFVHVPILGARETLHFITEDLARRYLASAKVLRFRLALATKPDNKFFLCHIPSQNLDNPWNGSNLKSCEQAKKLWTQATSRRDEGVDGYQVLFSRDPDAFAEPEWPKQSLDQLIMVTFADRMITTDNHPGLLRLVGARQSNE